MATTSERGGIRLISTDFDGTLVDDLIDPVPLPGLVRALAALLEAGVAWAVNTGRTLEQLDAGLRRFPVRPGFALTSEREVFRAIPDGGWEDFGDWNTRCGRDHDVLLESARDFLEELDLFLDRETEARTVRHETMPVGVVASTERELDRIAAYIEERREAFPQFHYQRNSVFLRFCHVDYHKGGALAELGRLLDIGRERTFAIGDNLNDLSMLDGAAAAHVACPSNSVAEVKERVRASGGFVASAPSGAGTLEAFRCYFPAVC